MTTTALAIIEDNNHSSTYTSAENLARHILARMESVAAKLRSLEDDIRKLWVEFDNLKTGETILGCATKKEFCERKLNRHPRTVQYLLAGQSNSNDRPRSELSSPPALALVPADHSKRPATNYREPTKPEAHWTSREDNGSTGKRSFDSPKSLHEAHKAEDKPQPADSKNQMLASLFMKVDRLLPQNNSFFCEGADSPERVFPQLIEDAIAGVQPTFTIAYNTFSNVYRHEALLNGKITHTFKIEKMAQVLDRAAASLAAAAKRVRAAARTLPKEKSIPRSPSTKPKSKKNRKAA
jgi:hypothetical protein